ncbi:MAG TPA: lysylphosphatidylglycerol synthase transmembrane domain-containing protein [Vicinamibacteria bacterium]|nr:lysylphosphatidylglycerol synthase transmembrane domain-containing protein [Vicinamibacteria bacterium]
MKGQRGRLLVGAFLAAVLLALFFRGIDWSALGQALRGARPGPLVGVVLVTIAVYTVRARRWGDLLAPVGRVRFADLFSATMVGFASGLLVPRAGELLRPWLVSRRYPVPMSAGFATIILERLVDMMTVLVLFAGYLFVLPVPAAQAEGPVLFDLWGLRPTAMDFIKAGGALALAAVAVVLALLAALHGNPGRVIAWLEARLARAPRWLSEPLGRMLHSFSAGLAVLRTPFPHLARIGLQSLVVWLLIALGFHLNHQAFGIGLPFHATFLLIAFLVVGVAIPTPGMVGGFHAFYLIALHQVYGIDRATAAAAGIAAHALTNLPILVFGLALLGREGLSLGRVAVVAGDEQKLQEVRP